MSGKKVSFAKHTIFYKNFFNKHKEMLEEFIKIDFKNIIDGYNKLEIFYSSYSYYLKDNIEYLDLIKQNKKELSNNNRYNEIRKKIFASNSKKLEYNDIVDMNNIFNENIKNIFNIFEVFCNTFAISDVMPDITENQSDYEKTVLFASYEVFYDCLFSIHSTVSGLLMNFNLEEFININKSIMAFYYGYSYYLNKSVQKEILSLFENLFNLYNDKDFLKLYFNLINNNLKNLDKVIEYKDKIRNYLVKIFILINEDLPKKNIMPMKKERILIDTTLI